MLVKRDHERSEVGKELPAVGTRELGHRPDVAERPGVVIEAQQE